MNISEKAEELSRKLDGLIVKAEIWQALFDECPIAIAVFTADMKFYMVNRTFCELTGFSKEQVLGSNISMILPIEIRREHKKKEREFVKSPRKISNHADGITIINKDFQKKPVFVDVSPFDHDGKPYYAAFLMEKD